MFWKLGIPFASLRKISTNTLATHEKRWNTRCVHRVNQIPGQKKQKTTHNRNCGFLKYYYCPLSTLKSSTRGAGGGGGWIPRYLPRVRRGCISPYWLEPPTTRGQLVGTANCCWPPWTTRSTPSLAVTVLGHPSGRWFLHYKSDVAGLELRELFLGLWPQ
jgi:hypothetical protein